MSDEIYNIKFVVIQLLAKKVLEFPRPLDLNENFNFGFTIDLKLFLPQRSVGIYTSITTSEGKDNIEVSTIKTLCVFEVEDFENIFKLREDGLYDIPVNLEITLKATSFSTSRGIAYSEYNGTYLQGLVIPLFDVASSVQQGRKEFEQAAEKKKVSI